MEHFDWFEDNSRYFCLQKNKKLCRIRIKNSMKGIISLFKGTLLCLIVSQASAIVHEKPINRPAMFELTKSSTFGGFNIAEYDASLIKYVIPAALKTFVETLRVHSESYVKSFTDTFNKAAQGKSTMISASFDKQTQSNFNVMIQDYLPMNEADAAAARYLFSVTTCAIRKPENTKTGLTMCQYYGARILGDIVKRLTPLHLYLTSGSLTGTPGLQPVKLDIPPEFFNQIIKIINLFSEPEIERYLEEADGASLQMWRSIKRQRGEYSPI